MEDLWDPLEMGGVEEERLQLFCCKVGVSREDCIWRSRGKSEDLQLAYLLPRPECLFLLVIMSAKTFCPFKNAHCLVFVNYPYISWISLKCKYALPYIHTHTYLEYFSK